MRTRMGKRGGRRDQRGFALIIVVLLVALLSIVAVSLLDVINLDLVISGQTRRTNEARAVADGVAMELQTHVNMDNDQASGGWLPSFTEVPDLTYVVADPDDILAPAGTVDPPDSYYKTPGDLTRSASTFTSDVRFLRYVPITETSLNWSRALVYELRTLGQVGPPGTDATDSTSEVRVEFSRVVNYQPGMLLPRFHAR
jgi:hypothetical protein